MSFIDWIYSSYPNPHIDGEYGLLHILTLVFIATFVVLTSILLRKRGEKSKKIIIWIFVAIIILFEVSRRVINFCKTTDYGINNILRILLPRPGCAIACWLVVIATIVNKKFLYNTASIIGILCGLIFFIYPGVGYNNQYILFENLYSIVSHTAFFIVSICFITYGFTDFRYKTIWKELICLAVIIVYAFLEIYVLKIEGDPFYFMQNNDVQDIVGLSYSIYLPSYLLFIFIYINLFYFFKHIKQKRIKNIEHK